MNDSKEQAAQDILARGVGFVFIVNGAVQLRKQDNLAESNAPYSSVRPSGAREILNLVEWLVAEGCRLSSDLRSKGWR